MGAAPLSDTAQDLLRYGYMDPKDATIRGIAEGSEDPELSAYHQSLDKDVAARLVRLTSEKRANLASRTLAKGQTALGKLVVGSHFKSTHVANKMGMGIAHEMAETCAQQMMNQLCLAIGGKTRSDNVQGRFRNMIKAKLATMVRKGEVVTMDAALKATLSVVVSEKNRRREQVSQLDLATFGPQKDTIGKVAKAVAGGALVAAGLTCLAAKGIESAFNI